MAQDGTLKATGHIYHTELSDWRNYFLMMDVLHKIPTSFFSLSELLPVIICGESLPPVAHKCVWLPLHIQCYLKARVFKCKTRKYDHLNSDVTSTQTPDSSLSHVLLYPRGVHPISFMFHFFIGSLIGLVFVTEFTLHQPSECIRSHVSVPLSCLLWICQFVKLQFCVHFFTSNVFEF